MASCLELAELGLRGAILQVTRQLGDGLGGKPSLRGTRRCPLSAHPGYSGLVSSVPEGDIGLLIRSSRHGGDFRRSGLD